MLAQKEKMFLLIPDLKNKRVLHEGTVHHTDGQTFTAQLNEDLLPAIGADVNIFAEQNGKFFQQAARVTDILKGPPTPLVTFLKVGKPCSAESRATFRVSVVNYAIFAQIDKHRECQIVDISPEGFAAVLESPLAIGSVVKLHLSYEGNVHSAAARVQTEKILANGNRRYGFRAAENSLELRKALQRISSTIQREQLRRLARSA